MSCTVCDHELRYEIERAILQMSSNPTITIEGISGTYNVPVEDIKEHAMYHTPLPVISDNSRDSLVKQMKLQEIDTLADLACDYLVVLKSVGRRINTYAQLEGGTEFERLLTKPVVDLYLGLGTEVRKTMESIANINQLINGPKDEAGSGLLALAEAIRSS